MNKIEEQLAVLLQKAIEVAEQTGEFAIEQAPLLLQEFYRWETAKAMMEIALGLALIYPVRKFIKFIQGGEGFMELDDELKSPIAFLYFIGSAITLPFIVLGVYNLVFIWTAPKLYLIEYFVK